MQKENPGKEPTSDEILEILVVRINNVVNSPTEKARQVNTTDLNQMLSQLHLSMKKDPAPVPEPEKEKVTDAQQDRHTD